MDKANRFLIYGTAWKKDATAGLVTNALAAGFRAVDTACQPKHYNEPGTGEALRAAFAAGMKRDELFIQTKFTPLDGQDHRVPYDKRAMVDIQVRESFAKSLENLHVTYLDSYLLHGPYNFPDLGEDDFTVWSELEAIHNEGGAKKIGISNVNALQLTTLLAKARIKPMVVQNRCYASRGWDRDVRQICRDHGIMYQGFSLLTANIPVLEDSRVGAMAEKYDCAPTQLIFAFALKLGMTPLTGTTNIEHMKMDLDAQSIPLTDEEVKTIESITSSRSSSG